MCGILGYTGPRQATEVLLEGLKKLEYRGYDSAGVAILSDGTFKLRRSVGKLSTLQTLIAKEPITGHLGMGHTRWATHGPPSVDNAHPHLDSTGHIVVVHNGIIENYLALKEKLQNVGYKFKSDTDTEVVAHLIAFHWKPFLKKGVKEKRSLFLKAVQNALKEIQGTYALLIVCSSIPDYMIGARKDCPLIVGLGKGESFLASDVPAVLSYTRDVVFLEEGDLAILSKGEDIRYFDGHGKKAERKPTKILWDPIQAEKSGHKHFMHKEILEQPRVVEDTLLGRLNLPSGSVTLKEANVSPERAKRISAIRIIACGTSWHAGLVGAYSIEKSTGIPCQVDIASEFRYRDPILDPHTLIVAISQSGETADTLAAIRLARRKRVRVLGIANVVGSSLTRASDGLLMTQCGPEIGVASTKAFIGQLVSLQLLEIYLAKLRGSLSPQDLKAKGRDLAHLSQWITQTLECEKKVASLSRKYARHTNFLYLGRNVNYPIALEGALKLKEVSYIHAEGYPAGEMKHGPIALIDENMPVVAIATKSQVYKKMLSNIEEARSRGAEIIAMATEGDKLVKEKASHVIYVPEVPEALSPIINVIPLQLLAYQIAILRGCDVDQPRNLAKSVTVE